MKISEPPLVSALRTATPRTGLYPVLLVVTDAAGATGPDTTTVTVK